MASRNSAESVDYSMVRHHYHIVDLAKLLDSRLEENKDIDEIADELEALRDEQTDEESQYTTAYIERMVVLGEIPLDALAAIDYTRIKVARAYRNAFSFLNEKCPSKLARILARIGTITPEVGVEMHRLLEAMRDPKAEPLAKALARFL